MPTITAPSSVQIPTTKPGASINVDCSGGATVRVDWVGPGGITGSRTVKNIAEDVPAGISLPDSCTFTLTALDGTATYTGPMLGDSLQALVSGAGKTTRVALLGNSITAQARPYISGENYTAGSWTPGGAVTAGLTLNPPSWDISAGVNFIKAQCITAGNMGTSEPLWPTTIGATVTDGTVVWQMVASTYTSAGYTLNWWSIAQALSGWPLDEVFICGQSGRQSDTILGVLDRALAASPDVVFFASVFENDIWPGSAPTLATISARFDAYVSAVDRVRALGKRVIVQTLLPSGNVDSSSGFTGYSRGNGTKAYSWLNQKIREMARARSDVILFEPDLLYLDPDPAKGGVYPENAATFLSQSGSGQQLKYTDGIHPYNAARWKIGRALALLLQKYFQAPARFGGASDETSRMPNPLKGGTTGTLGTNMSGTVATGLTVHAYGTGTGVGSAVARTDVAGNWQRVAYSTTVADNVVCAPTAAVALGQYAIGDVVRAFAEVRILAAPTLLTAPQINLRFNGAGAAYDAVIGGRDGGNNDQDHGQFCATDTTLVLATPPVRIPSAATGMFVYSQAFGRGAAGFTVDFGRESIQRQSVGALA